MNEIPEQRFGVFDMFGIVGGPHVNRNRPQVLSMTSASARAQRFCHKRYSPDIDQFQIFYYIDGDLWAWEKDGIEGLRVSPKYRWVRGSLFISKKTWSTKSDQELAELVIDLRIEMIERQMEHLRKRNIPFFEDLLTSDLEAYRRDYWRQLRELLPHATLTAQPSSMV